MMSKMLHGREIFLVTMIIALLGLLKGNVLKASFLMFAGLMVKL